MKQTNKKSTVSVIAAIVVLTSMFFFNPIFAQTTSKLPWSPGVTFVCAQGNHGSTSHTGVDEYAFDFAMADHTPVMAACGGVVTHVTESYPNTYSSDPNATNRVVIQRSDGTYDCYVHLDNNGVIPVVGQCVYQGQLIAYSGHSGNATGPHLHFMRMSSGNTVWYHQSIPNAFSDYANNGGVPTTSSSCTSQNYPSVNAPSGLSTANISSNAATIYWSYTGANYYTLYYKASSATYWSSLTVYATSYNLSGLLAGTTYQFYVVGNHTIGSCTIQSPASYIGSFSTPSSYGLCGTPNWIYSNSYCGGYATVGWTAIANANYYILRIRPMGYTSWPYQFNIYGTSTGINGLARGSNWEFQVETVCNGFIPGFWSQSRYLYLPSCKDEISNANENVDTTISLSEMTSINEEVVADNAISLSPNPVKRGGTINILTENRISDLAMYCVDGRKITAEITIDGNASSIKLPNDQSLGLYILRTTFEDGSFVSKRVIITN